MVLKRSGRKFAAAFLLSLLLVSVFLALAFLPLPRTNILWQEVGNAGHFVIFALAAISILKILERYFLMLRDRPLSSYLLAALGAIVIAGLTEILQVMGPRDASLLDFERDIAGVFAALGVYSLTDARLSRFVITRSLALIMALLATAWAFGSLAGWSAAYIQRHRDFPVLAGFESHWLPTFIDVNEAELHRVTPPGKFPDFGTGGVGRLKFSTAQWSGFTVLEPPGDWSEFTELALEVLNPSATARPLNIRIDDQHHNGNYEDRYNAVLLVPPGHQTLAVPLKAVELGPVGRKLDLKKIATLIIFAESPSESFELYFDNIRLQ